MTLVYLGQLHLWKESRLQNISNFGDTQASLSKVSWARWWLHTTFLMKESKDEIHDIPIGGTTVRTPLGISIGTQKYP